MKKEVFTQEFEKCFTVFQQVQLMKKFLSELDISTGDTSDKLSTNKSFTDATGNTYNGLVNWSTENDMLSYETKIYSNVLQDFSTYFYMGDDNIIMDNHYTHIGIEKDTLDIHCDVGNKYSITGTVRDDNTTEINIKADRLLHNGSPIGGSSSGNTLYSHFVTLSCKNFADVSFKASFNIILNTDTLTLESLSSLLQSNPDYDIIITNGDITLTDAEYKYLKAGKLVWDTSNNVLELLYYQYNLTLDTSNNIVVTRNIFGTKNIELSKDIVIPL